MYKEIKQSIISLLESAGLEGEIELINPPKKEMGDFACACFVHAKKAGKNPAEFASEIAGKLQAQKNEIVAEVKAFGPYVNFFINQKYLAEEVLKIDRSIGTHDFGKGQKYLIEFACPNPMKAFHLGHLKNLITGEAVVRSFENAGYDVKRVNYQGDVGMHIAKTLWGLFDWKEKFIDISTKDLKERVEFLGKAYAHGAQHFEKGEEEKQEVIFYNDAVYTINTKLSQKENKESLENSQLRALGLDEKEIEIFQMYIEARSWSLKYFDEIYKRMGSHFDRLYFESECFERGVEIVNEGKEKGFFKESEGAIIYEGSKKGLHDRVFINSKGFPTYEAKEVALAEMHLKEFAPDKVVHVVGKEQTEYFKVVFNAIYDSLSEMQGKEYHLPGGFLQLKGEQKMSSRKGNIITGDALVEYVYDAVKNIMLDGEWNEKDEKFEETVEKVAVAALKYSMLKADVSKDVAFDFEESLSVSGDSGPYLLYMYTRVKSLLEKAGEYKAEVTENFEAEEKELMTLLAEFELATETAVKEYDPSHIAKYLFKLAQSFSSFYANCGVLKADEKTKNFRLGLAEKTSIVLEKGLYLLGIETVDRM